MCKTSLENKNKIEIDKERTRERERGGKLPKVWEHKMGRGGVRGCKLLVEGNFKKGKGYED